MYKLWDALESAKKLKWVDLTHPLNNDSPYWSGIPEGSVELGKVVFDWGNPMLECQIQTFKFPGQFGTHIDFPGHFIKDAALSEAYDVRNMAFPLCVIDITDKVAQDVTGDVTQNVVNDASASDESVDDMIDDVFGEESTQSGNSSSGGSGAVDDVIDGDGPVDDEL